MYNLSIPFLMFCADDNEDMEGFHVDFFNGSVTSECKSGLDTRIIFYCNPSAVWDGINVSKYLEIAGPDDCQVSGYGQVHCRHVYIARYVQIDNNPNTPTAI